jgi:hypothetical protein
MNNVSKKSTQSIFTISSKFEKGTIKVLESPSQDTVICTSNFVFPLRKLMKYIGFSPFRSLIRSNLPEIINNCMRGVSDENPTASASQRILLIEKGMLTYHELSQYDIKSPQEKSCEIDIPHKLKQFIESCKNLNMVFCNIESLQQYPALTFSTTSVPISCLRPFTTEYKIDITWPWPKSGCIIFYSNPEGETRVMVSNQHTFEEISNSSMTIDDLQIFGPPLLYKECLPRDGSEIAGLMNQLFKARVASIYLDYLPSFDKCCMEESENIELSGIGDKNQPSQLSFKSSDSDDKGKSSQPSSKLSSFETNRNRISKVQVNPCGFSQPLSKPSSFENNGGQHSQVRGTRGRSSQPSFKFSSSGNNGGQHSQVRGTRGRSSQPSFKFSSSGNNGDRHSQAQGTRGENTGRTGRMGRSDPQNINSRKQYK